MMLIEPVMDREHHIKNTNIQHLTLLHNTKYFAKVPIQRGWKRSRDAVYIQYPSIKSLRSTIVERSFYGASVCISFQTKWCENGNGMERSENGV